jgi:hypothetical protein
MSSSYYFDGVVVQSGILSSTRTVLARKLLKASGLISYQSGKWTSTATTYDFIERFTVNPSNTKRGSVGTLEGCATNPSRDHKRGSTGTPNKVLNKKEIKKEDDFSITQDNFKQKTLSLIHQLSHEMSLP